MCNIVINLHYTKRYTASAHLLFRVADYSASLLRYYFLFFRTFLMKMVATNSREEFLLVSKKPMLANPATDVPDNGSQATCMILEAVAILTARASSFPGGVVCCWGLGRQGESSGIFD